MFQVRSLDHLVLTVADIAATCDLYVRVLGMEVVVFGGGRWALAFGEQKITFINMEPSSSPRRCVPRSSRPTSAS